MIRKATLDDIPLMTKIEMACFHKDRYPIDEESFYELMLEPSQVVLVHESVEHGVNGHLLAEVIGNRTSLSIDSVAVLPEFRNKGIGKDLIRAVLEYAKNRNIPAISLETPEHERDLHDFYESLNFKKIGREENFYGDGGACIIMKLIFMFLLMLPLPALAQNKAAPISLRLPVACQPGENCWLVNYPDSDPAAGTAKDFTCGPLTYDANDGTDFGIRDLVAMESGIAVVAAADGKVIRKRDGAPDVLPGKDEIQALIAAKKGCGNGIVLEHKDGWQTLYCHMKAGSFQVNEGQAVKAGEKLGLVGHSGAAEFPHLHFTLVKDSLIHDPFTGNRNDTACNSPATSLWNPLLAYEPVSLFAAGFAGGIPEIDILRIDAAAPASLRQSDTKTLSFWTVIYGAVAGDKIEIEIIAPDKSIVARQEIVQETTHPRQYYYIGKRFGDSLAPIGNYTGVITLSRTDPEGKTLIRTRDNVMKVY